MIVSFVILGAGAIARAVAQHRHMTAVNDLI
jgi:hypothetical protein